MARWEELLTQMEKNQAGSVKTVGSRLTNGKVSLLKAPVSWYK